MNRAARALVTFAALLVVVACGTGPTGPAGGSPSASTPSAPAAWPSTSEQAAAVDSAHATAASLQLTNWRSTTVPLRSSGTVVVTTLTADPTVAQRALFRGTAVESMVTALAGPDAQVTRRVVGTQPVVVASHQDPASPLTVFGWFHGTTLTTVVGTDAGQVVSYGEGRVAAG